MNREQWLTLATERLRKDLFKRHDADIPEVRLSVGFPGGGSARKRIGEYWHAKACEDLVPQIFISPVLSDGVEALDVLVHELVHACTPGAGHGRAFKRLALRVGLTGKMRSTVAGPDLKAEFGRMIAEIGVYPHSKINLNDRKKQSTRLGKVQCSSCGYMCRVTRKWLDEQGAPLCPCSGEQMEAAC
jgi:hypothetical protein